MVLVPELHAGDVVVFDNLKPHLASGVARAIEHAGAKVLPLPPYSSDLYPDRGAVVQGQAVSSSGSGAVARDSV